MIVIGLRVQVGVLLMVEHLTMVREALLFIQQNDVIEVGKTYKVTLEVLANEGSGNNTIYLGGTLLNSSHLSVGSYTFYGSTNNTNVTLVIFGRSGEVFEIDNVSVKEIQTDVPRIDFYRRCNWSFTF